MVSRTDGDRLMTRSPVDMPLLKACVKVPEAVVSGVDIVMKRHVQEAASHTNPTRSTAETTGNQSKESRRTRPEEENVL